MAALLSGIFFASGFAALVFETLWFRQAGLALGNSVWASSIVLSSFMAGLALGNAIAMRYGDRSKRPVRLYAAAEILIAFTGVGLVYFLPRVGSELAPWLHSAIDHPLALNSFRLVIAFLFLLIPSSAMGLTLPLLTRSLMAYEPDFGPALGRLYGWNTLGAVAGAVIGETILIGALGIRRTAMAAGATCLTAAAVALRLSGKMTAPAIPSKTSNTVVHPRRIAPWLWAAFCSGFGLLALEVVWFRFLLLFVNGHALSFALMLAIVLSGIALGGLAGARCLQVFPRAYRWVSSVAFSEGMMGVAGYAAFPFFLEHISRPPAIIVSPWKILALGVPLMWPVSFLSGIFFTFTGAALHLEFPGDAKTTGALTLANTTGAALGSLIGGFVLLPFVGTERSFYLIALLYGALGASLLPRRNAGPRVAWRPILYAFVGLWVVAVALFPFGLTQKRFLQFLFYRTLPEDPGQIIAFKEGLTETIIYFDYLLLGQPLQYRMITNAYSMSGTSFANRRYMKLFVYWPMAVHPQIAHALLICYGVGNTAKALTDSPSIQTIDLVDISRDVLNMNSVIYPKAADLPWLDPRVQVHIEDGRQFLQLTHQRFDLITAEPPPPGMAGVETLYSREYFQLLAQRLAPGGIVTYWLPLDELSEASAKGIVRAFCSVFEDCSLWNAMGSNLMLVGTQQAQGPVDENQFAAQWRTEVAAKELRGLGFERPEQLGALFIGDAPYLRDLVGSAAPLTDDDPKRIEAPSASVAEARRFMSSVTDTAAAAQRFEHSALIQRLWPPKLKERSLPYFDVQKRINAFFYHEPLSPQRRLANLHFLLTQTSLSAPVLWTAGSNVDVQRVRTGAPPALREHPFMSYQQGLQLLSERRYADAVPGLKQGQQLASFRNDASVLLVYTLCMSGQMDQARRRMSDPSNRIEPLVVSWLEKTFPTLKNRT